MCYLFVTEGISLSPCAKWNTTGITIAGNGFSGNSDEQLNRPQGIFLDRINKFLYVADSGNKRIQKFVVDPWILNGITVLSNIESISGLYVDHNEMAIYLSLRYENRVEKWMINGSEGEQIGGQCKQCTGVWLDNEKNVFMTESGTHTVLQWSSQTDQMRTVAGRTDVQGQDDDQLYFPRAIFIDQRNGTLYIADTNNNRIQKWMINAQKGVTIAGSNRGIAGDDKMKLTNPTFVWVDEETETIYIADTNNDRIQRWIPNQSTGTTILGGTGRGNESTQLSAPNSITLDSDGNLYVCDANNHRIQMFVLIENKVCPPTPSHAVPIK